LRPPLFPAFQGQSLWALAMGAAWIPSISSRAKNGMERHTIGLLDQVQRSPEHPEMLGLQVALKVLLGVPFSKKAEFVLILHALAKVTTLTAFLRPYGEDQGSDRL